MIDLLASLFAQRQGSWLPRMQSYKSGRFSRSMSPAGAEGPEENIKTAML
jgi:hypothetical protein